MTRMYSGEWTGTMALTEPQAGSSLGDITTSATPTDDGYYLIKGSKIFISGADHGITENIVNLTLARIDGAPDGTKGISLFAIPRLREENGSLVSNDVTVAGMIHKIGWRGLPSLALEFGDEGDCRGWLVGEPNQGLRFMFQMMNEARIMVGVNGFATASVAYHESRLYALDRKQGRALGQRGGEPVSIIQARRRPAHAASTKSDRRRKPRAARDGLVLRGRRGAWRGRPRNESAPNFSSICSRQWPRRSQPSGASKPTPWPSRFSVATATRASTCPNRTCAIRSSTRFMRERMESRAWICSVAR